MTMCTGSYLCLVDVKVPPLHRDSRSAMLQMKVPATPQPHPGQALGFKILAQDIHAKHVLQT